MGRLWNTILHAPRKLWLRRVLLQVHLWTGIGLGVYILLISVTGAALVFHDEMREIGNGRLFRTEQPVPASALLAPDEIRERAMALCPGSRLISISFPEGPQGTYRIATEERKQISLFYIHPQTGEHLGTVTERADFLRWLQLLHFNLLTGSKGRTVNGVGGLCLFLLCLTGVPLWWQGLRRWMRGLRVSWRSSWKRVNWDLHSAVGIYSVCFAALWGLTGAYFAFPDATRTVVGWFLPVSPSTRALRTASPRVQSSAKSPPRAPLPLKTLVEAAAAAAPGTRVSMILFPEPPSLPARVLAMPNDAPPAAHHLRSEVFVDRFSAKIVRSSLYNDATSGDLLIRWMAPLHFGSFGGVAVKICWLLLGLAPGLLAVTGTLMWWNRVGSKKFVGRKGLPAKQSDLAQEDAAGIREEVAAR